jgi:hypothetical protein
MGLQRFISLKPDNTRDCSLKLLAARHRPIMCPVVGCVAKFAEQKEGNRYIQNSYASMTESQVAPSTMVQMSSGEAEEKWPDGCNLHLWLNN